MLFSRYQNAREAADVNLIPVMNLFVTLIPFLLLAAAFYHVGVIPTSLPSQTDETSDIASDTISVTVNLVIEDDQLRLSASSAVLDEETLSALSLVLPKKNGEFDLDNLSTALFEVKRRYPKSDTVIVLPGDEVEYLQVIKVLDAARELTIDKGDAKAGTPLFPVVVMSRKV